MTDNNDESESVTEKLIVVGMNRLRLQKIMSMVDDEARQNKTFLNVEFIPCLAAMSSYEGENGETIRYMSTFVFHDGSSMNNFFDDEAFRESLRTVVMVGYEWKTHDEELVGKFFQANLLSVSILCVSPNPEFPSLVEEMNHFKNLTNEQKEDHASNRTMGPQKMKQFILDIAKSLLPASVKQETIETDEASFDGDEEDTLIKEKELTPSETQTEEEDTKRTPGFIDHNLTTFACKMCRTVLIGENNLAAEHKKAVHSFKRRSNHTQTGGSMCQSLFCDDSVLEWLAPDGADVEGKLTCSYCNFKLGHWNWSGAQCSCGTWVVPAIQIPLGKVDIILPPSERIKAAPIVVVAPKEI